MAENPSTPSKKNSPNYYEKVISNEKIIELAEEQQKLVRYQEITKDLKSNTATNQAEFKFQWKPFGHPEFKEKEDIMKTIGTLEPNGNFTLKGDDWSGKILPNGEIQGDIPAKLISFLSYQKISYDFKFKGKTGKQTRFVKKEFGAGGHAIATTFIYKELEKEKADEILKDLE